jgi:hypothetical protein
MIKSVTSNIANRTQFKKNKNIATMLKERETNFKTKRKELNNLYYKFKHEKIYQLNDSNDIYNLLEINPKVELHKFSISNNKIIITKYNKLEYDISHFQYAQSDDHNELYIFDVHGINIDDKSKEELISNSSLKNVFCSEDFSTLYLFHYKYDNHFQDSDSDENDDDINNTDFEGKKNKEIEKIQNFLKKQNIKLINDNEREIRGEIEENQNRNYKLFESLSEKLREQLYNSPMNTGGSKRIDKKKYIKVLGNYTMEKLQNIAKNKKISYTKKLYGNVENIKRETLIKKLCDFKFKNH